MSLNIVQIDMLSESNIRSIFGLLTLQVMIMKPYDPTGKRGPKMQLPDLVEIEKPKDDDLLP